MRFTYYGHACFSVEIAGQHLLFDPFISYNPLAKDKIALESVKADYIFISHGHGDHLADAAAIAKRTQPKAVVTPFEVGEWLEKQGLKNVVAMNHGGSKAFDFGRIKLTAAIHSSNLPDGSYGGNPCGFLCQTSAGSFYYSGDTALTRDMELVAKWAPDLAFAVFPIGDFYTMGADDAVLAAGMVGAKKFVGVHYDSFPPIRLDRAAALASAGKAGVELLLPGIGESIDV
ncbi:MAG: metal-dependent hydrolase [Verrucomicrobia bacterium]|nr:metal-dependent hydrolase [Verrucomicrobiota bacterium]